MNLVIYKQHIRYFSTILVKPECPPQIFDKLSNTKFNDYPSSVS